MIIQTIAAANITEIIEIIKLSKILVSKIKVKQLRIDLMTQLIFQILKKKIYNEPLFIILNFDSN